MKKFEGVKLLFLQFFSEKISTRKRFFVENSFKSAPCFFNPGLMHGQSFYLGGDLKLK
jgi:hypothetical protein